MPRLRCKLSLVAIFAPLFVIPAFAQNAGNDVQVQLSLAGGKSVYRTGEPIRLILSFTSNADGYQLNTTTTKPASPIDEILLTPDDGVSRWLEEYSGKHRYSPDYMMMEKIMATPAVVELALNDLFRFDRPGKYTAQVKTRRVSRPGPRHDPASVINLTTNEVGFEVIEMSKSEEEQEVRRLSAKLDATRDWKAETRIAEELSFLAGEASTREKVRRYLSSEGRSGNYSQEIHFGLFIARDRALVAQLLEGALRNPDTPVTHQLLHILTWLRLLREGMSPPIDSGFVDAESPEQRRSSEIRAEYLGELAASLSKRKGKSGTTTAITVLTNLPKDADRAAQMLGPARKILVQEFESLDIYQLEFLLNNHWDKLRDPSLQPALEKILAKERQPRGPSARAPVLKRLIELDPERSRSFVVAELRDPASAVDPEVLETLKVETLPEADAALLEQIRRLAPLNQRSDSVLLRLKALLVARYASPAIYEGLMEVYQTWGAKWQPDARAGLMGYFLRYNEAQTAPVIEQTLEELGPDQSSWFLHNLIRSNYPKALGDLMRKRLESDDPQWVSTASYIMSQHGPAEDMRLIEARLDRWMKEWGRRGAELDAAGDDTKAVHQRMAQVNLIQALLIGKAWKLPEEKIKQLKQSCVTKACQQHFPSR